MVVRMYGRVMVLESVESIGVRMVPLSSYIYDHRNSGKPYDGRMYIARHDTLSQVAKSQFEFMISFALDHLGKKYDSDDLGRILLRITTGLGHPDEDDAYTCSEYLARCYKQVGVGFQSDSGFYYPKHIGDDPHVRLLHELVQGEDADDSPVSSEIS